MEYEELINDMQTIWGCSNLQQDLSKIRQWSYKWLMNSRPNKGKLMKLRKININETNYLVRETSYKRQLTKRELIVNITPNLSLRKSHPKGCEISMIYLGQCQKAFKIFWIKCWVKHLLHVFDLRICIARLVSSPGETHRVRDASAGLTKCLENGARTERDELGGHERWLTIHTGGEEVKRNMEIPLKFHRNNDNVKIDYLFEVKKTYATTWNKRKLGKRRIKKNLRIHILEIEFNEMKISEC